MALKMLYSRLRLKKLFQLAEAKRLSIRMPTDINARQKIFKMMTRAAHVDKELTYLEEIILLEVKREYLPSRE
ncbi:MAG: hypothetical protein OEZ13_09755 [Spirochaetia bacterium]|nr:hypothetical protein [Spirochaetia bacterium]